MSLTVNLRGNAYTLPSDSLSVEYDTVTTLYLKDSSSGNTLKVKDIVIVQDFSNIPSTYETNYTLIIVKSDSTNDDKPTIYHYDGYSVTRVGGEIIGLADGTPMYQETYDTDFDGIVEQADFADNANKLDNKPASDYLLVTDDFDGGSFV